MGFEFKIDVMKELEEKNWTYSRIRDKNMMGQKTYYDMKKAKYPDIPVPGKKVLENICYMLGRQPGSIIRYAPDNEKKEDQQKK